MTIKSHANCNEPPSSSEKLSWTGRQQPAIMARPVILASYDNPLPYYNHLEENDKRKWEDDTEAASNIAKAQRKTSNKGVRIWLTCRKILLTCPSSIFCLPGF